MLLDRQARPQGTSPTPESDASSVPLLASARPFAMWKSATLLNLCPALSWWVLPRTCNEMQQRDANRKSTRVWEKAVPQKEPPSTRVAPLWSAAVGRWGEDRRKERRDGAIHASLFCLCNDGANKYGGSERYPYPSRVQHTGATSGINQLLLPLFLLFLFLQLTRRVFLSVFLELRVRLVRIHLNTNMVAKLDAQI